MRHEAAPARGPLSGSVRVPCDKSVSHRGVLFSAMSDGACRVLGALDSEDVRSTIRAVEALGATVEVLERHDWGDDLAVTGWGAGGPRRPAGPVDCGNSGTTTRLLAGVLGGWDVEVTLTGDASLSRRPMGRVTEPLSRMGARFETTDAGTLPMTVRGGSLTAIAYDSPVASAQVKSAVLLAGLRAPGRTSVREPAPSRDHTERLLPAFGVGVGHDPDTGAVWVDGPAQLMPCDVHVPGDPSSAAFLLGAAAIVVDSDVTVTDVALNPTRTGFARVLASMGVSISASEERAAGAEPIGAIRVRGTEVPRGVTVPAREVPSLIDEVPLLAVVATQAHGTTRFEGVGELRVKESDRLAAIADGLAALGATVRSSADWLEVDGPCDLAGATLDSLGDHRLAMAWAVAGLVAAAPVTIDGWECTAVSYPTFGAQLDALRADDGDRS